MPGGGFTFLDAWARRFCGHAAAAAASWRKLRREVTRRILAELPVVEMDFLHLDVEHGGAAHRLAHSHWKLDGPELAIVPVLHHRRGLAGLRRYALEQVVIVQVQRG